MKRYLPSKDDPPDFLETIVGVVFICVGWLAAVGIQGLAESIRWVDTDELMRQGLAPGEKDTVYALMFLFSMFVGLGIPLLAVAGTRMLRRRGAALGEGVGSDEGRRISGQRATPPDTAVPDVVVEARETGSPVCPYCKSDYEQEALVLCRSCDTLQHSECLAEHGRCAVCGQRDEFEPIRA